MQTRRFTLWPVSFHVPALWLLFFLIAALGCRAGSRSGRAPAGERTPTEIRRQGNHLTSAASAYLRGHAHNPVDWFGWGPEALALAVRLDRPIFLSIGYASCHWCHVMEKEVFEQDDVAAFLNEHFVSIKIDREERPDLDAAYMDAVVSMTGGGGWPMTVFLTPSLRPFFGGTYLPHDRFLQTARAAEDQFRTSRVAVETRGTEVSRAIAREVPSADQPALDDGEIAGLARRALDDVDPAFGGFRGRTKFPTPVRWKFLLHAYRKWGDLPFATALRKTLDAIDQGGLHDHVGGGFFRYSTEPSWTVPHFEKMLYDNAQLATLYLEASVVLDEPRYREVALETLEFLLREMRTAQGGFGASLDADSGGKEGAFYVFTPAELDLAAGETDGPLLAKMLGVTAGGNFEGSNVPTRRLAMMSDALSQAAASALWDRWRWKLYDARRQRPRPFFDTKMVTAWNGLALSAFALGYRVSKEHRLLDAAKEALGAVWRINRKPSGELARASDDDRPGERGVLDDNAFLALGLIDLFEATSDASHLERAVALAEDANLRFSNSAGGWFLTSGADQEPLGRRMVLADSVEPSGNAALILVLERLAALTGRQDFLDAVMRALRAQAATLRREGLEMAGWLDGALLAAGPFYELVIAGSEETRESRALVDAWTRLLPPWTVGARVGAQGAEGELEKWMPPAIGKRDRHGTAQAYVCVRGACQAPTADPARLRTRLLSGWAH